MCQNDSLHKAARGKGGVGGRVVGEGEGEKLDGLNQAMALGGSPAPHTCFSFSSSMRSRSSMQLRACRKAFLWALSVRMRTNSPDRLTLVKSTVLANSWEREEKKHTCNAQEEKNKQKNKTKHHRTWVGRRMFGYAATLHAHFARMGKT